MSPCMKTPSPRRSASRGGSAAPRRVARPPKALGWLVSAMLLCSGASAAPDATTDAGPNAARPDTAAPRLAIEVQRHTLPNGLRVVLNEDHSSPTVAVCVTYDVGSRNEQPGRSGFAHLFEHMMFQGSRNVGKGQHFELITERGGTLNGTTSVDRTNYYEVVPSNALSTVLWLEADRMQTLAVTEENFENQRRVVQEEYRMRVSNAAYAEGRMRLRALAFEGYWPHAHDPIGSMADLDAAKLEWLREFHSSYYAPNNAVITIAGDFEPKAALDLVHQYFGDAEATRVPDYAPPAAVPAQTAPRVAELSDANAKTPGLFYGWVIPKTRTPEHYALELAAVILTYGDSAVLTQELVRGEGLLRQVGAWTNDHRGPDLFVLSAELTERADMSAVEKRLSEELLELAHRGPTDEQLNKAKQRVQSYFLFGLEGNLTRATQLSNYELFWGDAALINDELPRFFEVTPEQIRAAVQKYLTPQRRSTVYVYPAAHDAPPTATPSLEPQAPSPAPAGRAATTTPKKENK